MQHPPDLQKIQKLQKHARKHFRDQLDFDLDIDAHGHCKLVIKTKSFEQLKATILALADFLTNDEPIPATKLGLAFGTPERR